MAHEGKRNEVKMKIKQPVLIALQKEIDHLKRLAGMEYELTLTSHGGRIMEHAEKEKRFKADMNYLVEFIERISDMAAAGK